MRTLAITEKVKNQIKGGGRVSHRKILMELEITYKSIQRILQDNLIQKIIDPFLTDAHKDERK